MIEYKVKDFGNFIEWHNLKDQLHRINGPAVESKNGRKEWWFEGQRHRDDGPAIIYADGEEWWFDGKIHKDDGPAVIRSDGTKIYYKEGKRHRTDGPAFISKNRTVYFINGEELTEEQFNARKETSCINQIIQINGESYKLVKI